MKLSTIITDYRNRTQISQREFARRCGLSNSYISFIENEYNPRTKKPIVPTLEQYHKIATGMGLTVHQLFEQLDDDSPVELIAFDATLREDEITLLTYYRGADDRAKVDALRMLADHQKKDTDQSAI